MKNNSRKIFNFPFSIFNLSNGQSLVELLIAMGLAAILLPALLTGLVVSREGKAQEAQRLEATALLREAEEAVRSVREKGWANVATAGTYHPEIVGSSWSLTSGSETVSTFFTRQVVISDVERDSNGNIVTSGGTVDTSTKKVVSTVSWTTPISASIESTNYLGRWVSNTAWTQTTVADFNAGTKTNTTVTNTAGGEVQLSAATGGDWATPQVVGSYNATGNDDANDVFVDGNYAYVGSNVGGGGAADFLIIDKSTPTNPTIAGTYNTTFGVNGVFVSGNYAYLATRGNSAELVILDITNKSSPSLVTAFNLGANDDANSVFLSGSLAYIAKDSAGGTNRELYIVNVSSPASPSITGSFDVSGNVYSVFVSGSNAYLATGDNNKELIVVNVSTPASPTEAGNYNANSNSDGFDVYVSGTTAYLGTASNNSGSEFYILNASTPSSISSTGSFEVGADVNGVFVSGTFAHLATSLANKEFLVLNITTPSTPAEYGSADLDNNSKDLYISGDYAYIASSDNSRELIIIQGGSGSAFVSSGTFESSTFDAGSSVAFNYLTFTISEPAGTDIKIQIAINSDNLTWNYFGPDGTGGTYYEAAGQVPLNLINGRYIRYKATFTGGTNTPVLSDVSVNYSP